MIFITKFIATVTFFIGFSSCSIISNNLKSETYVGEAQKLDDVKLRQKILVIPKDSRITDFDQTSLGKKIVEDMQAIAPYLNENAIVTVNLDPNKEAICESCTFGAGVVYPNIINLTSEVTWVVKNPNGISENINNRKTEATDYFHVLLFPVGLYQIVKRLAVGKWYSGVPFSLKFNGKIAIEENLVELNRIMIQEFIQNHAKVKN